MQCQKWAKNHTNDTQFVIVLYILVEIMGCGQKKIIYD